MINPSWSIQLPPPPSVNNLFISVGQKRVTSSQYSAWKGEADDRLWLAKDHKRFTGKVAVEIRLGKRRGLADCDNMAKACLDWLVRHQIIINDDSRYVRKVTTEWDDAIQGAIVTVRSLA